MMLPLQAATSCSHPLTCCISPVHISTDCSAFFSIKKKSTAASALATPTSTDRCLPRCQQQSSFWFGCQARGNSGGTFARTENLKLSKEGHCHFVIDSCFSQRRFGEALREIVLSCLKVISSGCHIPARIPDVHISSGSDHEISSLEREMNMARCALYCSSQKQKTEKEKNRVRQSQSALAAAEVACAQGAAAFDSQENLFYFDCKEGGGGEEDEEGEVFYDCYEVISSDGFYDAAEPEEAAGKEEGVQSSAQQLVVPQPQDNAHPHGGLKDCAECELTRRRSGKMIDWMFWFAKVIASLGLVISLLDFLIRLIRYLLGFFGAISRAPF